MKLIIFINFAFVYVVCSQVLYQRDCIYIDGICDRECELGTHAYTTGCGYLTPEPTCDEPNPKPDLSGLICDFSSCYCNPPTVRNPKTKRCVPIQECGKN